MASGVKGSPVHLVPCYFLECRRLQNAWMRRIKGLARLALTPAARRLPRSPQTLAKEWLTYLPSVTQISHGRSRRMSYRAGAAPEDSRFRAFWQYPSWR
jgi:hypothetical protein